MTIGVLLKVLALVIWLIAFVWGRLGQTAAPYNPIAAGLFFWFVGDLIHL